MVISYPSTSQYLICHNMLNWQLRVYGQYLMWDFLDFMSRQNILVLMNEVKGVFRTAYSERYLH